MICKLCQTDAKLRNSHIIPEFMYQVLYDSKHRVIMVPANKKERVKEEQKGIREKLLCQKCESQLSKYEKYVSDLVFGGELPVKVIGHANEYFEFANLDYPLFKLFLISILWRASVSTDKFFTRVSLGRHEEIIRLMLLTEQPGTYSQYGCTMDSIEASGEPFDVIRMPDMVRDGSHHCYRFLISGFMWTFVVSSHSDRISFKQLFLQEDGRQIVRRFNINELTFLKPELKLFGAREKDMRSMARRHGHDISQFD